MRNNTMMLLKENSLFQQIDKTKMIKIVTNPPSCLSCGPSQGTLNCNTLEHLKTGYYDFAIWYRCEILMAFHGYTMETITNS